MAASVRWVVEVKLKEEGIGKDVLFTAIQDSQSAKANVLFTIVTVITEIPFPMGPPLLVSQCSENYRKDREKQMLMQVLQPFVRLCHYQKVPVEWKVLSNDKRDKALCDYAWSMGAHRLYVGCKKSMFGGCTTAFDAVAKKLPTFGCSFILCQGGKKVREVLVDPIQASAPLLDGQIPLQEPESEELELIISSPSSAGGPPSRGGEIEGGSSHHPPPSLHTLSSPAGSSMSSEGSPVGEPPAGGGNHSGSFGVVRSASARGPVRDSTEVGLQLHTSSSVRSFSSADMRAGWSPGGSSNSSNSSHFPPVTHSQPHSSHSGLFSLWKRKKSSSSSQRFATIAAGGSPPPLSRTSTSSSMSPLGSPAHSGDVPPIHSSSSSLHGHVPESGGKFVRRGGAGEDPSGSRKSKKGGAKHQLDDMSLEVMRVAATDASMDFGARKGERAPPSPSPSSASAAAGAPGSPAPSQASAASADFGAAADRLRQFLSASSASTPGSPTQAGGEGGGGAGAGWSAHAAGKVASPEASALMLRRRSATSAAGHQQTNGGGSGGDEGSKFVRRSESISGLQRGGSGSGGGGVIDGYLVQENRHHENSGGHRSSVGSNTGSLLLAAGTAGGAPPPKGHNSGSSEREDSVQGSRTAGDIEGVPTAPAWVGKEGGIDVGNDDDDDAVLEKLRAELAQLESEKRAADEAARRALQASEEVLHSRQLELQRLSALEEERVSLRRQMEESSSQRAAELALPLLVPVEGKHLATAAAAAAAAAAEFRHYTSAEVVEACQMFSSQARLGEGSFGTVYRGTLDGVPVTIKRLKDATAVSGLSEHELQLRKQTDVRHPNLVVLRGSCDEPPCLVYELMANGSLRDRLACQGGSAPLPWHVRFRVLHDICRGMLHLHSMSPPIVHRDLKPANVLLDCQLRAKVGEVGLAALLEGLSGKTFAQQNMMAGSVAYLDPHYIMRGQVSTKSDVYSIGVLIWDLLGGLEGGAVDGGSGGGGGVEGEQDKREGLCEAIERAVRKKEVGGGGGKGGGAGKGERPLEGLVSQLAALDPSAGAWPAETACELATLAVHCSSYDREDRPCMADVLRQVADMQAAVDAARAEEEAEVQGLVE
eukprot:jgi/Mesen1/2590/ME000164S01715